MRLMDLAMRAPAIDADVAAGSAAPLRGAGSLATAIASTDLRYVLDRPASETCRALVFQRDGPLADPDDPPRLPDRPYWLECFADEAPSGRAAPLALRRLGFLVDARPGGAAGSMDCVFQLAGGDVHRLPARVEFDLSAGPLPEHSDAHRMRHAHEPAVDRLLSRARLVVDRDWRSHVRGRWAAYGASLGSIAEVAWCALPLVLSFAALLEARRALVHRPSALHRLNRSRAAAGRQLLLDHVEIGLDLAPKSVVDPRTGRTVGGRGAPRLHFVRGHSVSRDGRTFWRSSHLRGVGVAVAKRTVLVTAGAGGSGGRRRIDPGVRPARGVAPA